MFLSIQKLLDLKLCSNIHHPQIIFRPLRSVVKKPIFSPACSNCIQDVQVEPSALRSFIYLITAGFFWLCVGVGLVAFVLDVTQSRSLAPIKEVQGQLHSQSFKAALILVHLACQPLFPPTPLHSMDRHLQLSKHKCLPQKAGVSIFQSVPC